MAICPKCGGRNVLWRFFAYTDDIDVMKCFNCHIEFYVKHADNSQWTTPEEVDALNNKFEKLTNMVGILFDQRELEGEE
jgi:hypothetical protein